MERTEDLGTEPVHNRGDGEPGAVASLRRASPRNTHAAAPTVTLYVHYTAAALLYVVCVVAFTIMARNDQ